MDEIRAERLRHPIGLKPTRVWRTYIGGKRLDELQRAEMPEESHFPEEWMLSIVEARNAGREHIVGEGLSVSVPDGIPLRTYIESFPEAMLGEKFFAGHGRTTGVLLKLIDAAERLTIQVHPDREHAETLFHSPFGKTECWHILDGCGTDGTRACIYIGFKPEITREYWQEVFERQDIAAMLDCLHRFEVEAGQTILIEGGVPHAIGKGCFLMEIQEPTDYTIRTERSTPSGDRIADVLCHQGIGFERMMDCFRYEGLSRAETQRRWFIQPKERSDQDGSICRELIGYENTPCFKLEKWRIEGQRQLEKNGSFYGLYVLDGNGWIQSGETRTAIEKGSQFFVPAMCDEVCVQAERPIELFCCYGPQE